MGVYNEKLYQAYSQYINLRDKNKSLVKEAKGYTGGDINKFSYYINQINMYILQLKQIKAIADSMGSPNVALNDPNGNPVKTSNGYELDAGGVSQLAQSQINYLNRVLDTINKHLNKARQLKQQIRNKMKGDFRKTTNDIMNEIRKKLLTSLSKSPTIRGRATRESIFFGRPKTNTYNNSYLMSNSYNYPTPNNRPQSYRINPFTYSYTYTDNENNKPSAGIPQANWAMPYLDENSNNNKNNNLNNQVSGTTSWGNSNNKQSYSYNSYNSYSSYGGWEIISEPE